MELIELKNLSLGYGQNVVIKNLNLIIQEGDFVCVVGPNGSGKSTLIKGILGLIKPLKGKVIYHQLSKNFIGYMPQEIKVDAHFPASSYEIILSGTLNKLGFLSFYNRQSYEKADKVMNILHIEKLKNKNFCDLSGGERQRVLLARSLCATDKLLILDEPSNNLDMKSKKELYEIIQDLNHKGITIIMITHDLDHDNLLGNKILSLREDNLFYGDTEEFIRMVHHE